MQYFDRATVAPPEYLRGERAQQNRLRLQEYFSEPERRRMQSVEPNVVRIDPIESHHDRQDR